VQDKLTMLQFEVPTSLKQEFKIVVTQQGKTLRQVGENLIKMYLNGEIKISA
jgi:hypothetical protein